MQYGNTALSYAAERNNEMCAKMLLDHGIDVNSKNEVRLWKFSCLSSFPTMAIMQKFSLSSLATSVRPDTPS